MCWSCETAAILPTSRVAPGRGPAASDAGPNCFACARTCASKIFAATWIRALRKVGQGLYDAIVLAAAGLHRMGWQDRISAYLDEKEFVPAIGQGAIGIEARADDESVLRFLAPLHHPKTAQAVEAERGLLRELEGGCQVPIGGHARVLGEEIELTGLVASLDGERIFHAVMKGPSGEAGALGVRVARKLLDSGAAAVLDEIYRK